MITKALFTTVVMLGIMTLTIIKLPRWMGKTVMRVPSWLQALVIHFGYGGWVGGVTGHMLGGFLSIPWFFISEYFLRPKLLGKKVPKLGELIKFKEAA